MNGYRLAASDDPRRPPSLAYDARFIGPEPPGIGQVCLELLRGLSETAPDLPVLVLVTRDTHVPAGLRRCPSFAFEEVPWSPYGLANQCFLPGLLRRHQIRLLHAA